MSTRLAVVVKLKQREQDKKLESFAESLQKLERAREAVEAEHRRAQVEQCRAGTAADWALTDSARGQALVRLKEARQRFGTVEGEVSSARGEYARARGRTESVRRLADTRHDEHRREVDKREDRTLDELSLLGFARRAANAG